VAKGAPQAVRHCCCAGLCGAYRIAVTA